MNTEATEGIDAYSWHASGRHKKWGNHDGLRSERVSGLDIERNGVRIDTCSVGQSRTRDHRVFPGGAALLRIVCRYLGEAGAFDSLCQALSSEDQVRLARALRLPRAQLVTIASEGAGNTELVDQMQIVLDRMKSG
jgi:hypothetical protein